MKNFLLNTICYILAITVAIGQRLLPVLDTSAQYLWSLLVEPEQAPVLATVLPLPVTPVPVVQPEEATPVKAVAKQMKTSTTTAKPSASAKPKAAVKPRAVRKRTTKATPITSIANV